MISENIQVVIAEDNKDFNLILSEYLSLHKGIKVIGSALNGIEAIDLISSQKPDVVILDVIMPHLDGIGVLKKINTLHLKNKPLFIMLTAIGNEQITREALDLGAAYFMIKPFDMAVLVEKILSIRNTYREADERSA